MLKKAPLSLAVSAAIGATAALGMAPAFAQEDALVEEVVVTGSRIQRANLVSSSPVTQLDAEQLRFTGVTRVEDALAAIPAISLDQSSGQAIESVGTATMQLRNLGSQRTLVLMNGRRMPASSPNGGTGSSAADINLIPGQLVQRVEVLTGGASSTYGADAVAGVVNFIMMDDFEGISLDYQFAQYRHDAGGGPVATAAEAANQPFPRGTVNDGDINDVTLILGSNFDGGRGNATAFVTYRDIEGVTQDQRPHSACPVRSRTNPACLGSATNQSGSVIFLDDDAQSGNFRVDGNTFAPGFGPGFNFAAPSFFQRPDRRTTGGVFAHYDVNERVEAYTELLFMDTRSLTQFGPAGVFFNTVDATCDNPFLSDQQRTVAGCAPGETFNFLLGRRNVEGGPRDADIRHTTYRGVFGVRGDLNDTWRYDVSYQYAEVDFARRNTGYADIGRFDQGLDAVAGPDGRPVCVDPSGGCVPINVFSNDAITQEMVDFYAQQVFETGRTTQEVLMGYVQGSLGDYGIVSPFAESGVEVVIGAEYREESLTYNASDNALRGNAGGFGIPVPVDGRYDVREIYVEASIPVIENAPLAQSVLLDLGYRYSDYDPTGTTTNTWKIAGNWSVTDDIKFRGSFQRAVRAPNVVELFEPVGGGLYALDQDPCEKANPGDATSVSGYTFEQCARTGVSQAIWDLGGPQSNPASQYNQFSGGSLDLEPEEADTLTLGFILTPSFIDGLTVSVDYYDIEIEGAIQGIAPETTLIQCLETGDALFCDGIKRGLNDSLWLGDASPENGVDARITNIGFLAVEGVDVEVTYNFDVGNLGTVNIANIAGFVLGFDQEEYPGAGIVQCDGIYGGACGLPTPDLKNRFQATWATPWDVTASFIWRYVAGTDQEFTNVPNDIDDYNYFDVSANWAVTDWATLRFGINNLLDEEPPFVYQGVTARENGNTYPGIYDVLGQYWFAGVNMRF